MGPATPQPHYGLLPRYWRCDDAFTDGIAAARKVARHIAARATGAYRHFKAFYRRSRECHCAYFFSLLIYFSRLPDINYGQRLFRVSNATPMGVIE